MITRFDAALRELSIPPEDALLRAYTDSESSTPSEAVMCIAQTRQLLAIAILKLEVVCFSDEYLRLAEARFAAAVLRLAEASDADLVVAREDLRSAWLSCRDEMERRSTSLGALDGNPVRGDLYADLLVLHEDYQNFGPQFTCAKEVEQIAFAIREVLGQTNPGSARAAAILAAGATVRWRAFGKSWLGGAIALEMVNDPRGYCGYSIEVDPLTQPFIIRAKQLLFANKRYAAEQDDNQKLDLPPHAVAEIIREAGDARDEWSRMEFADAAISRMERLPRMEEPGRVSPHYSVIPEGDAKARAAAAGGVLEPMAMYFDENEPEAWAEALWNEGLPDLDGMPCLGIALYSNSSNAEVKWNGDGLPNGALFAVTMPRDRILRIGLLHSDAGESLILRLSEELKHAGLRGSDLTDALRARIRTEGYDAIGRYEDDSHEAAPQEILLLRTDTDHVCVIRESVPPFGMHAWTVSRQEMWQPFSKPTTLMKNNGRGSRR